LQLNGEWDAQALVEVTNLARRKFLILDWLFLKLN
jgi:hypothetical protein